MLLKLEQNCLAKNYLHVFLLDII